MNIKTPEMDLCQRLAPGRRPIEVASKAVALKDDEGRDCFRIWFEGPVMFDNAWQSKVFNIYYFSAIDGIRAENDTVLFLDQTTFFKISLDKLLSITRIKEMMHWQIAVGMMEELMFFDLYSKAYYHAPFENGWATDDERVCIERVCVGIKPSDYQVFISSLGGEGNPVVRQMLLKEML